MKQTKEEYDVVESRTIQAGRFQIVCDTVRESGRDYPYSYVKIKDCAAVLCIVEQSVLLLRQYRHTLRSWEYEIPAGSVEDGENPEEAANLSLEEYQDKVAEAICQGILEFIRQGKSETS